MARETGPGQGIRAGVERVVPEGNGPATRRIRPGRAHATSRSLGRRPTPVAGIQTLILQVTDNIMGDLKNFVAGSSVHVTSSIPSQSIRATGEGNTTGAFVGTSVAPASGPQPNNFVLQASDILG